MAGFLRGKQAGIQNDLSAGILPGLFAPDDLDRFGINSQIGSLAYDPVQSLLAIGTNETTFGSGQIYIFGQKRVQAKLILPRRASVKTLQFCADRLISVDSKNEVIIWDLATAKKLAAYSPPGVVTTIVTDPMLDWCLIGLQNGDIICYDLDREKLAPLRLPNFWREKRPRSRLLSSGAPGGNGDPMGQNAPRQPRLTQALWHPTGTFIATAHDDASIVFWDPKDGRIVMARTLQDTHENPDDTGLLVAGGVPTTMPTKGMTFMDISFRTPTGADIADFCLIPRASPHFAGAQDPIAIIALLTSGELVTLTFPTGHPISPTNQLHPSLSFVHPFVNFMTVSAVDRGRWLARNIIQTAHGDGTVRIWDVGHGDELENSSALQVDIARAVARFEDVNISAISMASSTGELCVGTTAGEAVIYRWGGNRAYGSEQPANETLQGGITDISVRAEPSLKEGLQPFILYDMAQGPISAIRMSDVGFVAVGSEGGAFSIIDLRGPTVIFTALMTDFIKQDKRSSFMRKGSSQTSAKPEWPVCIEFGVMTLDDDKYSSIACFVGTSNGKVATFKILPQQNGGYTAQFVGITACADKVISITPIVAETGKPASANWTYCSCTSQWTADSWCSGSCNSN
ncbi:hypothetical protein EYC84_009254 [Monilinia fructicola]|uniref:Lethal giant larvae (Lgl)-like C-terminal domain-containing protein n=1 Tax=Monilinia fructicola TaxID=38448 RepID=A0A5M9JED7_MONFR|nr:hypothetical protein EYC84_009254 [Monilinia fructicola]